MSAEDIGLIQGLLAEHRDWSRTQPLFFFEMLPQGWLSSSVLVVSSKNIPNELWPVGFARRLIERRRGSVDELPFFREARWAIFW
jgi:hypothetical protein